MKNKAKMENLRWHPKLDIAAMKQGHSFIYFNIFAMHIVVKDMNVF